MSHLTFQKELKIHKKKTFLKRIIKKNKPLISCQINQVKKSKIMKNSRINKSLKMAKRKKMKILLVKLFILILMVQMINIKKYLICSVTTTIPNLKKNQQK